MNFDALSEILLACSPEKLFSLADNFFKALEDDQLLFNRLATGHAYSLRINDPLFRPTGNHIPLVFQSAAPSAPTFAH